MYVSVGESRGEDICDYSSIDVYPALKRLFDVVAVIVTAPLVLALVGICALLIKCDGGPAFFSQPRVGKDGVVYRLWKLRSMVPNAEKLLEGHLRQYPSARTEWEAMQKLRHDPRITRFGRWLRKYSLDELPQLYNVLTGEMSLVGPRPMLPEQRQYYPGMAYDDLRPGLTGLWQVSERNGCTFGERALYDTRYSNIISFAVDLWILWRTPSVLIKGTGI